MPQPRLPDIPIYKESHERIPDSSYPIKTVTFANQEDISGKTSEDALHLVVAHGAWGGPHTMGPLVRYALRAAAADKKVAAATLYSDPWFGFRGYAAADRAERFDKVLRETSRRTGRQVHMVAHSWSGSESLEIASRAHREQRAASFIAYTLANRIEDGEMSVGSFLLRGLRELKQGGAVAGWRSIGAIGAVGLGAFMHGVPALPTAVAECSKAFNTRLTPQLVQLSNDMRVGVALAGRDAFFGPGDTAKQHLQDAGFDEANGAIHIMPDATHMGAVSNFRNGRYLYDLVADVASRPPIAPGRPL